MSTRIILAILRALERRIYGEKINEMATPY
jgi:hypothetical protein